MMNNILLNEVYDFEFRSRWKTGRRFVLNSAWQGSLDYDTNLYNTKYLRKKMVEELNLEVLRIAGRYAESMEKVECMVSFPPDDVSDEMLKRFFYYYGRRFKQNAIFFIDERDMLWILPTRPMSTYGNIGKVIKKKRFVLQDFPTLVTEFMRQTYELDFVRVPTD